MSFKLAMIISNSRRFIFVHIPKTAGTSITHSLSKLTTWCDVELGGTKYGDEIEVPYRRRFRLHKHSGADAIASVVGEEVWNDYFTFAFVRNPFDRLVSAYHFYRQWPHRSVDEVREMGSFKEFVFSSFLEKDRQAATRPTGLQSTLLTRRGEIAVKKMLRYESLVEDFRDVSAVLGADDIRLPKTNASKRGHYADYYDEETALAVRQMFREDFDRLGYADLVE